jgi:hypothetical protein
MRKKNPPHLMLLLLAVMSGPVRISAAYVRLMVVPDPTFWLMLCCALREGDF